MSLKSGYPDVSIPDVSLPKAITKRMSQYGNRIALIDDATQTSYTYHQLLETAKRVASGLLKLGIRKGDVVSLFSTNTVEWIVMFWSVIFSGGIVSGMNPTFTKYELIKQLKDSNATMIYTIKDLLPVTKEAIKELPHVKVITMRSEDPTFVRFEDLIKGDASNLRKLEEMEFDVKEDVVALTYSSGTTGLPKGVMITHYNLMANIAQLRSMRNPVMASQIEAGEKAVRALAVVPLHHAIGITRICVMSIEEGVTIIVMHKFQPQTFLKAIERYKITRINLVPTLVNFMIKSPHVKDYDLSSVEAATCGAAPLSRESELEFVKKLKIPRLAQGYGMTELTLGAVYHSYASEIRRGSSGKVLPLTEAKIVDVNTGVTLGPHQKGELWIRGPQVMKGYYNKPEITRQTIDKDRWLHTGDIGYYDEEEYIFIVDRIKELIKVKGTQVAPAELEGNLLEHPHVQDAAVVGVPDERAGELPRAYVVKKPGKDVTEEDLYNYIAERTAPYKHLKGGICFISEIPRVASGKILRRHLKEMAAKTKNSKL